MKDLIHELRWRLIEMDAATRMFMALDRQSTRLTWIAVAAAVLFILLPAIMKGLAK